LKDVFDLQSEVARSIAREIGAVVTVEQDQRLARSASTNPVAAEAYFKGRFYWNRRTADDILRAIRFFEQAVSVDPNYARAYAGLADSYVLLGHTPMSVLSPAEALPKARAAAGQALAIHDDLVEAQTSLAYVETYEWNWDEAERSFKRAISIDPSYGTAHFWYAALLGARGRLDESVAEARRGTDVEPLSPIIAAGLAWMLHLSRRHQEAADQAQKVLQLEPDFPIGHLRLGVSLGWLKRYDEAIAELKRGRESAKAGEPAFVAALVRMYASSGRAREARDHLDQLLEMTKRRYLPAYSVAIAYAALGDKNQAMRWLEKAFEEKSQELTFIAVEPEVDVLRTDARFQDLMRRMKLAKE
jgi:tetratricopeptide (TPR) repeat protein